MALEGNGNVNFASVGQSKSPKFPEYASFGYQSSNCWSSGTNIESYANGTANATELLAPVNPHGPGNYSYCFDELFVLPLQNIMDRNRVNILQDHSLQGMNTVKLDSGYVLPNVTGIGDPGPGIEHARSASEEATSSQSTVEMQTLKKRKSLSNGDKLLKHVASDSEKEKEEESRASELTLNKENLKQGTKQELTDVATEANSKQTHEKSKPPELSRDYIHVRARRGQATDSHSLAERVRREKISERMKVLQDLVPGCNKITGKAVMLDEIINYVQSLQQQVEILSMKLEAVNPKPELHAGEAIPTNVLEPSTVGYASNPGMLYPQYSQPEWTSMQLGVSHETGQQLVAKHAEASLKRTMSDTFPTMESYRNSKNTNVWGDELHTILEAGVAANITQPFSAQTLSWTIS